MHYMMQQREAKAAKRKLHEESCIQAKAKEKRAAEDAEKGAGTGAVNALMEQKKLTAVGAEKTYAERKTELEAMNKLKVKITAKKMKLPDEVRDAFPCTPPCKSGRAFIVSVQLTGWLVVVCQTAASNTIEQNIEYILEHEGLKPD
jgi:hypothetical protein